MSEDYAFSINKAVCMQAHDEIGRAAKGILDALQRIDADGKLLLTSWDGEAREAFLVRQRRWHEAADTILQKLRQINSGLAQAVVIYDGADKLGAQRIAGG